MKQETRVGDKLTWKDTERMRCHYKTGQKELEQEGGLKLRSRKTDIGPNSSF